MSQSIVLEGDQTTGILEVDLDEELPEEIALSGDLPDQAEVVELYGDFAPSSEDDDYLYGDFEVEQVVYADPELNGELGAFLPGLLKWKFALPKLAVGAHLARMAKLKAPKLKMKVNTKATMKGIKKAGQSVIDAHKKAVDTLVTNPLKQVAQTVQSVLKPPSAGQPEQDQGESQSEQQASEPAYEAPQQTYSYPASYAPSMPEPAYEQYSDYDTYEESGPEHSIESIAASYQPYNDDFGEIIPDEAYTFDAELNGPGGRLPLTAADRANFRRLLSRLNVQVPIGPRGGFLIPALSGDPERVTIVPDLTDPSAGELGFFFPKKNNDKKKMMAMNAIALASGNKELIHNVALLNIKKSVDNKKKREKQKALTNNIVKGVGVVGLGIATGGLGALPALLPSAGAALPMLSSALGPMAGAAGPLLQTIGAGGLQNLVGALGQGGLSQIVSTLGQGGFGSVLQMLGPTAAKLGTPEGIESLIQGIQTKKKPDQLAQYLQQALTNIPQPAPEQAIVKRDDSGQEWVEITRTDNPVMKEVQVQATASSSSVLMIIAVGAAVLYFRK